MFAYCNNNPVMFSDCSGSTLTTSLIAGAIGAVTAATCGYVSGERGLDLIDSTIKGFLSGAVSAVGIIVAIDDAVTLGIEVAGKTGNEFSGLIAGMFSLGVSMFSGSNVSRLPGVIKMDDAAELFFDGVFGYGANLFFTLTMTEVVSENDPAESHSHQSTQNTDSSVQIIRKRNPMRDRIYVY